MIAEYIALELLKTRVEFSRREAIMKYLKIYVIWLLALIFLSVVDVAAEEFCVSTGGGLQTALAAAQWI